jgi:hypothetical protein
MITAATGLKAFRLLAAVVSLNSPLHAQLVDLTQPGDPIVATSNMSPAPDGVANAIDNQPTRYLNFACA